MNEAVESAREKAEEVAEVTSRLRQYERGQFGLEEAVAQLEAAKRTVKVRERELEEVTQEANKYEYRWLNWI